MYPEQEDCEILRQTDFVVLPENHTPAEELSSSGCPTMQQTAPDVHLAIQCRTARVRGRLYYIFGGYKADPDGWDILW